MHFEQASNELIPTLEEAKLLGVDPATRWPATEAERVFDLLVAAEARLANEDLTESYGADQWKHRLEHSRQEQYARNIRYVLTQHLTLSEEDLQLLNPRRG